MRFEFVLAAYLLAVLSVPPTCGALLAAYRRRITKIMTESASQKTPGGVSIDTEELPATYLNSQVSVQLEPIEEPAGSAALHISKARALRAKLGFCYAALGYGIVGTSLIYVLGQYKNGFSLETFLLSLILVWPIVPTLLNLAGRRSPLTGLVCILGYLGALLVFYVIVRYQYSGSWKGLAFLAIWTLIPATFVLITGTRGLRGAAWFVAPAIMATILTLLALVLAGRALLDGKFVDTITHPFTGAYLFLSALSLPFVCGYAWVVVSCYRAKWLSDDSLLIVQWWFVASVSQGVFIYLGTNAGARSALFLLAFAVFVLILASSWLLSGRAPERPLRLLLLRTFGARRRSTRLLRDLTRHWRWIGSIELITGPDLATEVLEPDEFIDYATHRLDSRCIRDSESLRKTIHGLDLSRDLDGRYRINELICSDDAWQHAFESLADAVDVILMDLRNYRSNNSGATHELRRLVESQRLDRVVAIVDGSTDVNALTSSLREAALSARPVTGVPASSSIGLRTVYVDSNRTALSAKVFRCLAQMSVTKTNLH